MGKNYYPQVFLEECKYIVKEKKVTRHITGYLDNYMIYIYLSIYLSTYLPIHHLYSVGTSTFVLKALTGYDFYQTHNNNDFF